jgi:hypothetical protein
VVVLPAPFGPSRASTSPRREADSRQHVDLAVPHP